MFCFIFNVIIYYKQYLIPFKNQLISNNIHKTLQYRQYYLNKHTTKIHLFPFFYISSIKNHAFFNQYSKKLFFLCSKFMKRIISLRIQFINSNFLFYVFY